MAFMIEITPQLEQVINYDNKKLAEFDDRLDSLAAQALEAKNPIEAFKQATLLEYALISMRTYINKSLSQLKTINQKDLNDRSLSLIRKHEQTLISRNDRLTQLREDISVLQKLVYSSKQF